MVRAYGYSFATLATSWHELLNALTDYVDDKSVLAICQGFAEQAAGCNPCQVVVDTSRKTIQWYKAGKP